MERLARLGDRAVQRPGSRSAARRWPASTCRPRSVSSRRWDSSTRSRSRRSPTSPTRSSFAQIERDPPAGHAGQDRGGAGADDDAEETNEFITFLRDVPARLRRHRALRRLVRHRQLALDHDRAADARVRDAADARAPRTARFSDRSSSRRSSSAWSPRSSVCSSACCLPGVSSGSSTLVGFTLPNTGLVFEPRTIVSRSRRGSSSRCSRASTRASGRRWFPRSPPCARARRFRASRSMRCEALVSARC